ncbi:ABC transporter [Limnochorda pilosa]|uniref:ABC transporter n=1 Tax=Limnochorda pilosa TaxID=1555112 RepID=A0A0K2SP49_LIMPI|nr:ABC transporter [Limnochorda pilosa]
MLRVRGLSKRFGPVRALTGVDLEVQPGEVVALLGPSGCGKSTLLRCVDGLEAPDEGEVEIAGVVLREARSDELPLLRRRVGFVFQGSHLLRRLTAEQNVAIGLVAAGQPTHQALAVARAALERVGMGWAAGRRPEELSGGERQRVAIARALVGEPLLMLWDEPTASLDPVVVHEILKLMEGLVAESDRAMLLVTHQVGFARQVAHRLVFMEAGRVVESGPPEEVLAAPRSQVARRYQMLLGA